MSLKNIDEIGVDTYRKYKFEDGIDDLHNSLDNIKALIKVNGDNVAD